MMKVVQAAEKLARETIGKHKQETDSLCAALGLSAEDVVSAWVAWDTGVAEYDNDIYNSPAVRVAMHLHNYVLGSWHDKRQGLVLRLMEKIRAQTTVDVGFGTPQRYVTEYMLDSKAHLTLTDFDQASLSFAELLLDLKSGTWREHITLREYDMDSGEPLGSFGCYLFQDSIEHAKDPSRYLNMVVSEALRGAHFIFSLPIEVDKAIPEHNIFWKDASEVHKWLERAGLSVEEEHDIAMNPELDLYAQFLHPDFKEVVIHAIKA